MTISQKLRIAQKNHLGEKLASDQFQLSLHIWPLLKKIEFFGAQTRYDILRPSSVSGHCPSIRSRWPLLRGGGRSAYP